MNIAEHIAYLIGDSKREVILDYENYIPNPIILTEGFNEITYTKPTALVQEIEHPEGLISIQTVGAAASYNPVLGWVGNLSTLEQGNTYTIRYEGEDVDATEVYSITPDIPLGIIKQDVLESWIKGSIVKISKLMPSNLKLHMTASKSFTAGQYNGNTIPYDTHSESTAKGIDLNIIDSSDIIAVTRWDGEMLYDCRQIPLHMRAKARFGSGFLEECSETDPIYYVTDNFLSVEPSPEDTHSHELDGFCTIDYVSYPSVIATDLTMNDVPFDMQNIILIATAAKCKKYQIHSLKVPSAPVLNPDFKVVNLDNPDTVDAIEKAQQLIDNYSGDSFKDFLSEEDIDMAKTALTGSAAQLEIAKTELAEQDKAASEYLSEYSQNISKFTQEISSYVQNYKKFSTELEMLEAEYQELIYSMRGELPNKKQLKDTEKKLETIKQVVQRN
tara:strand:- start:4369 stop:5700 length:1332 start_codon:yes stop_codon:yes gene_type:complete